jgi:putative tryptophan/tyrosine transport system substrate-binding protein
VYRRCAILRSEHGTHKSVKRREFISLIGCAVAAWPLAARAQQRERMRRIGVLMPYAANDPQAQARNAAFLQGLQQFGWTVGHNVEIEYRWSGGNIDDTRKYAAELVALAPDVIFVPGSAAVAPLRQVTRTVPIVFGLVADPVGSGFVDSLARPGGNVTGFSLFDYGIGAKWLELLKEIAPNVTRAAILRDPAIVAGIGQWAAIQSASPSVAIEVSPVNILPAIYYDRYFVAAGGLMSYGPDNVGQFRRAASYVDRILKGEKPADLPVQAPTKFETVLNLKTAKALGLDVPTAVLARADEVIE